MTNRPNILFINTDQQSQNTLSAYGNPYLQTPNMDRLHQNGVSFNRAYSPDPVCAATRASWMTGRYSSEIGVPFNGGQLHSDLPDLGQLLNGSGYNAYHCGKWHVDGREIRRSFHNLYTGQRDIGAGGGEYYDSASTHAALSFLSTYSEKVPFYLQVGYVNPHDVCEYLHNHEHKSVPDEIIHQTIGESELPPLPANFEYDRDETILQQVCRRQKGALIHDKIRRAVDKWSGLQWQFYIWNYYRYVEKVDSEIGLLLNGLVETGLASNTLIIFTSDHGEACASHHMFQKFTLYQESVRVPFIVASLGGQFGLEEGTIDDRHFLSGVDILPTVCDYARVKVPDSVQGQSLRPLVEGRETDWRSFAFIESNYWGRAIVTDRYKYIMEYQPSDDFTPPGPDPARIGKEQLFDLSHDPGETKNLARLDEYQPELVSCRQLLLNQETELNRRPLTHQRPQRTINAWRQALQQAWSEVIAGKH